MKEKEAKPALSISVSTPQYFCTSKEWTAVDGIPSSSQVCQKLCSLKVVMGLLCLLPAVFQLSPFAEHHKSAMDTSSLSCQTPQELFNKIFNV